MAGLWSRVTGSSSTGSLERDLRRITEEDKIDAPKDELLSVVQASHNADDRREIMRHLHSCLKEDSGKRWRRIHGGLILAEHLLQRGSPQLLAETAEGHHFDLVQRLTFLEGFEHDQDKRVQNMVRQKAGVLRQEMLRKLDSAEEATSEPAPPLSMTSQAARSSAEERDVADNTWHGVPLPDPSAKPASNKGLTVNGLVSVGHKDDTTSDESEGEQRQEAPAARKKNSSGSGRKEPEARRRNVVDESTDSDSSGDRQLRRPADKSRHQASSTAPAAPALDLLDF